MQCAIQAAVGGAARPRGFDPRRARLSRGRLALGGACPAPVDAPIGPTPQRVRQRRESEAGLRGYREIAGIAAHRVGTEQRIDAHVDHLGVGARAVQARDPGHVAIDHQDQVRLADQAARLEPHVHLVVGGQRDVARTVGHDRQRISPGDVGERLRRGRVLTRARGDDHRVLGRPNPVGGPVDRVWIGRGARSGQPARRAFIGEIARLLGQHLARQGEINRPPRLVHRHVDGAVDDGLQLAGVAQLVVPLDHLADHARLVEHLLAPVDVDRPRARRAGLGQRRPAGSEDDRHVLARGVGDAADRVGGPHIDVDHYRLRLAGGEEITMRHGDREVFVRHRHRCRRIRAVGDRLGQRLDDRGEVGPRIAEQVVDAPVFQEREIGFRQAVDLDLFLGHGGLPSRRLRVGSL